MDLYPLALLLEFDQHFKRDLNIARPFLAQFSKRKAAVAVSDDHLHDSRKLCSEIPLEKIDSMLEFQGQFKLWHFLSKKDVLTCGRKQNVNMKLASSVLGIYSSNLSKPLHDSCKKDDLILYGDFMFFDQNLKISRARGLLVDFILK